MKHLTRITWLLILITSFASSASAQYGHVGSDEWFAQMRKSAANQAMLRALMRKHGTQQLPADYIEFAGRIVFPEGNPFPKQRIPDLRIKCRDSQADEVERAPFVDDEGGFYTVFKRGQTYDLYWMYAFGSREKFASIFIRPEGGARRKHIFEYRPQASDSRGSEVEQPTVPARAPQQAVAPPADVDTFDLSGFPPQPTNFEEQQVMEEIKYATTAASKALAHERLARYYEKRGDLRRARAEYAKAAYWRSR